MDMKAWKGPCAVQRGDRKKKQNKAISVCVNHPKRSFSKSDHENVFVTAASLNPRHTKTKPFKWQCIFFFFFFFFFSAKNCKTGTEAVKGKTASSGL